VKSRNNKRGGITMKKSMNIKIVAFMFILFVTSFFLHTKNIMAKMITADDLSYITEQYPPCIYGLQEGELYFAFNRNIPKKVVQSFQQALNYLKQEKTLNGYKN
jgi:hypothetical protein